VVGAEACGEMEKRYVKHGVSGHFLEVPVPTVHAAVARSTFSRPRALLEVMLRRCGAKQTVKMLKA